MITWPGRCDRHSPHSPWGAAEDAEYDQAIIAEATAYVVATLT